jgi:hypothetical protein
MLGFRDAETKAAPDPWQRCSCREACVSVTLNGRAYTFARHLQLCGSLAVESRTGQREHTDIETSRHPLARKPRAEERAGGQSRAAAVGPAPIHMKRREP